ncbi:hypothetical protein A176_003732 [Myxococcus hansupus]|uniref:Uncharacterized protein n=1 Tax=Pseudomyxococcus hansupus TaxID=1297742 RepID=A0A0H4WZM3_9BACT|nr:hypothetical protein [Myxococcus hansupus]AKQ66820.1 hypothetical protein A176_003732 [Myxococcus hansupus]
MSWYSGRVSELNDLMNRASEGAADSVTRALRDGISKVGTAANSALDFLFDASERASASNLGTQRKWRDRCVTAQADISRAFGDAAKDHPLTPALQLFWYQALAHEMAFFDALSQVSTPQLHDDLLVHQDLLNKMLGELWDKWTFLLSKDVTFENDQRQVVQQVARMAQKIVDELAPGAVNRLSEGIARATSKSLDKARQLDDAHLGGKGVDVAKFISALFDVDIPDGIDRDLIDAVQGGADVYQVQKGHYRSLVSTYQSLVQAEKGSVLLLFNSTRAEVLAYYDKNDLGKARVMLDQAKGRLADWASRVATSAQRDVASSFMNKVCSTLDVDWKLTEELDGKFRDKFKGIFIQALGNETVEQLAESYLFRQHLEEVTRQGAASKLKALPRGLQDEADKALSQGLRPLDDLVGRVPEDVRELARLKSQKFKDHVRDRLTARIQALLPAIVDLAESFETGNLSKDFSREDLERSLR